VFTDTCDITVYYNLVPSCQVYGVQGTAILERVWGTQKERVRRVHHGDLPAYTDTGLLLVLDGCYSGSFMKSSLLRDIVLDSRLYRTSIIITLQRPRDVASLRWGADHLFYLGQAARADRERIHDQAGNLFAHPSHLDAVMDACGEDHGALVFTERGEEGMLSRHRAVPHDGGCMFDKVNDLLECPVHVHGEGVRAPGETAGVPLLRCYIHAALVELCTRPGTVATVDRTLILALRGDLPSHIEIREVGRRYDMYRTRESDERALETLRESYKSFHKRIIKGGDADAMALAEQYDRALNAAGDITEVIKAVARLQD